ncbi:MAG: hypothetical protein A2821_02050 [Candidatus Magasanikbacteria bacterium RIFCSPHIGHO2_01_FULL_41_23]|uniref:Uncharacterized protein n=1 Tax=Candidatus Magasanikbacteria bacterium RIFCSPLOWO2_01_FULL_40_15 TaxID=1798686 RepID=A0A1F6N2U2_9BACT|nr:MAG: hypothetical protein A2821_02050 [Candidatus Magasanikbacteria bacterium RIFCSPHIGHO2_01_FULL_41_23]OGH67072.1 MAG: hypothetical protein A3C66_00060 [Candidatus Magasanikbacteria bacterium RIFCSPHIGHO2_02_FULL_41_35]OGH75094.1 MAG: hypothetical protein A3F22_04940 [Candidatus Magasanikbacteria bacterium RIFCSPHIGHO2_12_FULL_41_16]OGH78201.1 MAG: hypothetical protein A2983_00100 [Candidatus Magasanikbacteria bacterium RIFCSPLOWO2_01_FULL_40_15]
MSIGDENRSTPGQLGVDPADGIDIMRYRDRPSQEDILNEAERMAKGILILSRIVKEKFERVLGGNNVALKGTPWENWRVEDCHALFDEIRVLREVIELDNSTPQLDAPLYEDRKSQLDDFIIDNSTGGDYPRLEDDASLELVNLATILKRILDSDPGDKTVAHFRKKYEGWTEKEVRDFYETVDQYIDDYSG